MGLAADLKVFIDSESGTFVAHPSSLEDAGAKWGQAFGDAFEAIIAPSAASGLSHTEAGAMFTTTLTSELTAGTKLGPALDAAAEAAADTVMHLDTTAQIAPPSESLASDDHFLLQDSSLTAAEVAAEAEARFTAWVTSGTYTAWWIAPGSPPSGAPGVPATAWGADPPEPPPTDEDGDGLLDKEEGDGDPDGDGEALSRISKTTQKFMPYITLETFESIREKSNDGSLSRVGVRITYSVPNLAIGTQVIDALILSAG